MAYATVSEVQAITGVSLDTTALSRAQYVIELHSNRQEAASGDMSERDLHWLKLATVYQAAFMDQHPEVFTTMNVESMSQGDLSVTFRDRAENLYLGPLAKKALQNVSWMRTRSVLLNSHFARGSIDADTDDYADADNDLTWENF